MNLLMLKDQIQNKLGLKPFSLLRFTYTNKSLKDQIQNKLGLKPEKSKNSKQQSYT